MSNQLELFPGNHLDFNGESGKASTTPLQRSAASRSDRIRLRNQVMVARLYYWREIMRRRLDDVIVILAENEFLVDERTINNAWLEYSAYFEHLCGTHTTARQLQRQYPCWRW